MIYLVEDDSSIRELVTYTLNNSGYDARGFGKPSDFWSAMDEDKPQMILLDVMLPEEDGISILKRLKENPSMSSIPIIMLSAKGSEYDKVIGLDNGADDYVSKPFGMMELLSRIKALFRRSGEGTLSGAKDGYKIEGLSINLLEHRVMVEGKEVALTLREFEMLKLLLQNMDIVLSRDTILTKVWGYAFDGETRTVDVHIRSLRQKLGNAGYLIETIRGVGYRISSHQKSKVDI